MRITSVVSAVALVVICSSAATAQTVYDATEENGGYVIERVNPRAAQLVRALSPCCQGELIPGEQFRNLERPFKNGGVWSTSPYTIMKRVGADADGDPNYYRMKDELKQKEASPANVKDREPAPRAIIKIPVQPEGKPLNPDAEQGRVIIRPWKAGTRTVGPTA